MKTILRCHPERTKRVEGSHTTEMLKRFEILHYVQNDEEGNNNSAFMFS